LQREGNTLGTGVFNSRNADYPLRRWETLANHFGISNRLKLPSGISFNASDKASLAAWIWFTPWD